MPRWLSSSSWRLLSASGFELRNFENRGEKVFYVEGGPQGAPTLVVFPGFGDTIFSWALFLLRYGRRYRVIGLDFPGYIGMSRAPTDGHALTFEDQERVALRLLEKLQTPVHCLVGNSLGGWLAMRAAANHSEKIQSLALLNPGGVFTDARDIERIRKLYDFDSYSGYINLMRHLWYRIPLGFYPVSLLGLYQFTKTPVFRGFLHTITPEHCVNELLPTLRQRIAVIWGSCDRLFEERMGRFIAERAPRASFHLLDRCGHMPQTEAPRALFRTLDPFLTRS